MQSSMSFITTLILADFFLYVQHLFIVFSYHIFFVLLLIIRYVCYYFLNLKSNLFKYIHHRYIVSKLVKTYFKKQIGNKRCYVGFMPDSLKLFFSTIFTQHAILDHSNMQLTHPIFYSSDNRMRFLNVVIDLKARSRNFFYCNTYLHCSMYGLHDWRARIPISSPLREVYDYNRNKYHNNVYNLPEYLRNLHKHFHVKNKVWYECISFLVLQYQKRNTFKSEFHCNCNCNKRKQLFYFVTIIMCINWFFYLYCRLQCTEMSTEIWIACFQNFVQNCLMQSSVGFITTLILCKFLLIYTTSIYCFCLSHLFCIIAYN